jgi:hypothetical protein
LQAALVLGYFFVTYLASRVWHSQRGGSVFHRDVQIPARPTGPAATFGSYKTLKSFLLLLPTGDTPCPPRSR